MAALTDNLPLASSSRRIIDPGDSGPSWLGGIASTLSKGIDAVGQRMDENEVTRRRAAADEAKAREEGARNEAAGLAIDHALGRGVFAPAPLAAQPTPTDPAMPAYVPIDASLEGPPPRDVTASIDEASRARAAEEQGRAPSGSSRIVMERALMKLLADYPDQRANILKEFRENGFDHYLMRERDTAEALYDAEVAGQIKQQQDYANAAVSAGAVLPGTDLATAAAVGQGIAHQDYLLKRQKEEAEAAARATAEGRASTTFQQEQADREVTTNFQAGLSAAIAPSLNALSNLFTQSNGDQTVMQLVPETLNALDMVANNWITAAMQNNAPPETVRAMREVWASNRSNIVDLVNGPGSEIGVSSAILKGMENQLGINMMQALPVMVAMKDLFGLDGLERAFGDNPATMLPQEIKDSIKREINGITGAIDTSGERVSMATVAQLLRGQLSINEMSESQARTVLPAMVTAARGQLPAISRGAGNVDAYVNANLQIANAAMELQPGNSNARSEAVVTMNIFDRDSREADSALIRRDPTNGQVLIQAKRGAAMHMLSNINNRTWQQHPTDTNGGLWTVQYNAANGTYQTVITDASYAAWARNQRQPAGLGAPVYATGGGGTPSIESLRRAGAPRPLTERIQSINLLTSYLVQTNPHDEDFQGVGATEARRFFIEGIVPASMRQRQEAEGAARVGLPEQIESFRRQLDSTRTESLQVMANEVGRREVENTPPPANEVQQHVKTTFEGAGVPWDVVDRLVRKESGWRLDPGPNGSMVGMFQVKGGSRDWRENVTQGLDHWLEAGRTARAALGREPTPADQYVAYQQGVGGGAALLDPDNADKTAWEVLLPLYRREYGDSAERVAKQAVTGNRGTLNMTAAQFAQHIRDYFNR